MSPVWMHPIPRSCFFLLWFVSSALAAERHVDPTWLHRSLDSIKEQPSDLTSSNCHYHPIFGMGDPDATLLRGIVRYGEIIVDSQGTSQMVTYKEEEQVYFVREGNGQVQYGAELTPIRPQDFMYLAPGIAHGIRNSSDRPLCLIVMGFRVPNPTVAPADSRLLKANLEEVPRQEVAGHPPSTLYQLLMGAADSKRDKIAAARVLTSLFVMEFDVGGTNFPHHHDREEEIYLVLDGHGDMVAGGGMDGVEGRHPAQVGDAYFFRLNCTVGFYNEGAIGKPKSRILAVRSLYPFSK
jgi:mannose-6-phosphate isomerase-like protein (cupin superfamily)